jgi:hypothetical protein
VLTYTYPPCPCAGHNIGMLHSGLETDNYGDHSCVMGSWTGLRYYNAPVQWSAGFAGTIAGGDLTSTTQMPLRKWTHVRSTAELSMAPTLSPAWPITAALTDTRCHPLHSLCMLAWQNSSGLQPPSANVTHCQCLLPPTHAGTWISFAIPALAKSQSAMLRLTPGVTGTSDTYFVSFRAPVGFDSGMPYEAKNRVQVSEGRRREGAGLSGVHRGTAAICTQLQGA